MEKSVDRLIVFMRLDGADVPVGELVKTLGGDRPKDRRAIFRYARSWLERAGDGRFAPELDPSHLPVVRGDYPSDPFQVPLAFYDATPDGFGRSVLRGAYPAVLFGTMEYLAAAGINRTGALSFGFDPGKGPVIWRPEEPMLPLPDDEETVERLIEAAAAVVEGEATNEHFKWLLEHGSGNIGGARPKARLSDEGGEWIAKFSISDDPFDNPLMEAVCLSLAAECGIDVPDHKHTPIGRHSVLRVRRFDRSADGEEWLRYLSAATLLGEEPNSYRAGYSYADIAARALEVGVAPCEKELFARLLFNCFINNTDDHLRNTAFVGDTDGWRISKAYDLVPQQGTRLVVAPAREISPAPDPVTAFEAWSHMRMEYEDALEIYDNIVQGVGHLGEILDQYGVSARDREITGELMAQCRNPPTLPAR